MPALNKLEELEDIYMDGSADQISGSVESPTGHFYRVGSCIVVTNSQGFSDFTEYANEAEAIKVFELMDEEYSEWEISQ